MMVAPMMASAKAKDVEMTRVREKPGIGGGLLGD